MVAGTVTMDFFLANKEARRDGWAGGLRGDEAGGGEVGVEGEWRGGVGKGSVQFLCSSFIFSFLEVTSMGRKVVR